MNKMACNWEPDIQETASGVWQQGKISSSGTNTTAFYKFNRDFSWRGIEKDIFSSEGSDPAGLVKQVLIGNRGESCSFSVRYFELAAGCYSSQAKQGHEHVLICIRGRGKAVINENVFELSPLDTLYISNNDDHRIINAGNDPFGFLCIVDSDGRHEAIALEDELLWLQHEAMPSDTDWSSDMQPI
jgi:quercetin dioxygenase-like cupin family protein